MNCYTVTLCDREGRHLPETEHTLFAATARDAARQAAAAAGLRGPNIIKVSGPGSFARFRLTAGRLYEQSAYNT
jgi:hypothetical protein